VTTYNVGDSVPYAASAATQGFTSESHQYYWTFDDGATAGTQTTAKVWATEGVHSATVRATQPITGGVAYAQKSMSITLPVGKPYSRCYVAKSGSYIILTYTNPSDRTASGVYISANGGTSFAGMSNVPSGSHYWTPAVISNDGQYAIIADYGGSGATYRTTSYGYGGWTDLGLSFLSPDQIATDDGEVYANSGINNVYMTRNDPSLAYSRDRGATWSYKNPVDGVTNILDVACGYNYVGVVFSSGYKYSTNAAATFWPTATLAGAVHCACDDTGQGVVVLSSDGHVYVSSNYGADGSFSSAYNPASGLPWVKAAMAKTRTHIYVADEHTVYNSLDGGSTWQAVLTYPVAGGRWTCVATSRDGGKVVAVGVNASGNPGYGYITNNFGANWTLVP